ncbi:mechanosensitive ion channel family protein [Microbacterium sp. Bi128]|uniref:mechanosensitive ion channel family protein n=1 Tax=Microbacterium sp. Bi128 TaxID=2821115 RepID=UPI001D5ACBC3|nr:mechanosensitive ion channel domain-containing protein [Microbacterium sp. Bi128]CAH0169452.1 Miniconductance mechanosensitive channel MscM [Microbacterium sp. Bi128]
MTEEIEQNWQSWGGFAIVAGVAVGVVIAIMIVVGVALTLIGRRKRWAGQLRERVSWPFRITLLLLALTVSISALPVSAGLRGGLEHLFGILVIIAGAWLLGHLFLFFVDSGSQRYRLVESDTFSARKIRTQLQIVRRLVIVVIVVVAAGGILMTFDAVRAVGASVLASAGIASIVAGLAAQSVLSNLFAGVQLAFSEAIRVGDVVVVEGEYGRIQEITLSYVVLELWDQRTLVLPCTYFTTNPFENWTKLGRALLGTVYFDLDWRVPVDQMRLELERILTETELWDRAAQGVQVTDAVGGMLQVRILVSADDSGRLWDLRCLVREKLAEWVRTAHPEALPLRRVQIDEKPMDATVVREQGPSAPESVATAG